jgi:hypothetical protein
VLTPKHGSWLNIVETPFGKMAQHPPAHPGADPGRNFDDRVLLEIAEIDAAPVVRRSKNFDALASANQDTLLMKRCTKKGHQRYSRTSLSPLFIHQRAVHARGPAHVHRAEKK